MQIGLDTNELTLLPALFDAYPNVNYWKIDFIANNGISTGRASLTLKQNILPTGGSCSVDLTTGVSLSTYFNIVCTNWIDPDGSIVTYEFMGI